MMSDGIDVAAIEDAALAQLNGEDVAPCAPPTEATLSEAADDSAHDRSSSSLTSSTSSGSSAKSLSELLAPKRKLAQNI